MKGNPESGKLDFQDSGILLVESGTQQIFAVVFGFLGLESGMQRKESGIPLTTWNLKSEFHWQRIERFSFEYRKTKTKVNTLANHKGHRQYSEPIKTRSNYM